MKRQWLTKGFESFRRGLFGNGGQNLYVSKKGVLQRIFQFDFTRNGWFDLPFANCQNHHESTPSVAYMADGRVLPLPGQGSLAGIAVEYIRNIRFRNVQALCTCFPVINVQAHHNVSDIEFSDIVLELEPAPDEPDLTPNTFYGVPGPFLNCPHVKNLILSQFRFKGMRTDRIQEGNRE